MKAHRNRRAALMLNSLAERRAVRLVTQRLLPEDVAKPTIPSPKPDSRAAKAWSQAIYAAAMRPSVFRAFDVIKMSCAT